MYPRVIRINEKFKRRSTSAELYDSIKRKVEPLSTVKVQENRAQNLENGDCKAMHDWQLTYQPACNNIHEINMNDNKFLAQGGFRSVWAMLDGDGSEAVIKTLVWRKEFREKEKDRHRRDATVYMMLQDSKHIPNIYGYCTNSAVFDVAKAGTLSDILEDEKRIVISTWKPADKLRYAWQITKAIADMHSIGNIHNSAAISHTDIASDQILWIDGMFKLNDFNRARFITWNAKKEEACPFFISKNMGKHRSPEEYTKGSPLTEKIDVYSLGNLLWALLREEDVWESVKQTKAIKLVKMGTFPTIPSDELESYSEMEKSVHHAMNMCYVKDVLKRSSSLEVEKYLHDKLEEFEISEI